jgi:hypothetical protein
MSAENKRSAESVALLMVAGLMIVWLGVVAYCMFVLNLHGAEPATIASGVVVGAMCVAWIVRWLRDRRMRGLVLLDCGAQPSRLVFLVGVLLFTWLLLGPSSHVLGQWRLPLVGLWGAFSLIGVTGRLQVTEGGVSHYGFLIPWLHISSHGWTRDGKLVIFTRSRFIPRVEVLIRPEQRDAADELMDRFCASQREA